MIKRKIKAETQELQNAQNGQGTQQNYISNKPKRKLVSLSDINPSSINKEQESEPSRKINMSDLVREAEEEYYKNPLFRRPEITEMQELYIGGYPLSSLLAE